MKLYFTLFTGFLMASFAPGKQHLNGDENTLLAENIRQAILVDGYLEGEGKAGFYDVRISSNGDFLLYIAGRSKPVSFNLYRLYKNDQYRLGIGHGQNNQLRFQLTGSKSLYITFATQAKAQSVYNDIISLMMNGKDSYSPGLTLDIHQTVDSINSMLDRLTDYSPQVKVSVNGIVVITNANKQFFHFNITSLASSSSAEGLEINGIEMIPSTVRNVAANNWINFNNAKGKLAYIKFYNISDAELNTLHQLFIHLRHSMIRVLYS